jgi:hypothetical protein
MTGRSTSSGGGDGTRAHDSVAVTTSEKITIQVLQNRLTTFDRIPASS